MKQSYRAAIIYFTLFALLLLLSGTWLFVSKIGLTPNAVNLYYLGNEALFQMPKSPEGVLEIALPHLGGMGLFIMVSAHFMLFASAHRRRWAKTSAIILFAAAVLDILSPYAIINGLEIFSWIKLLAFFLLQGLALFLLWLIFLTAFEGIIEK